MRRPTDDEVSQLRGFLSRAAADAILVTYTECMQALAVDDFKSFVGLLSAIQDQQDGLGCDLSALVVSRSTGRPGRGWDRGATEDWPSAVARCYAVHSPDAHNEAQPPPADPGSRIRVRELRYDPGNAGDLLKHGWLAAVARWLLSKTEGVLRYADPFAGNWDYNLIPAVSQRLERLGGTLLSRYSGSAWQNARYLGSTGLVGAIASHERHPVEIWVGDRCEERTARLIADHGCREMPESRDGYAALRRDELYDLILLDPFRDFVDQASDVIPKLVARTVDCSILLFTISTSDSRGARACCADALRRECSRQSATVIAGGIPGPIRSRIRGESGYEMEVAFLPRTDLAAGACSEALPELAVTAVQVAAALGTGIEARLWMQSP